jgi:hypothetical protein
MPPPSPYPDLRLFLALCTIHMKHLGLHGPGAKKYGYISLIAKDQPPNPNKDLLT